MKKASNAVLDAMIPIAEALTKTIGSNCEIAIHDLTNLKNSIYYISNGEITGRKAGDSLSSVFKDLVTLAEENDDSLINYYTVENGRPLKCTKVLIRDDCNDIIGIFCVNIAIDDYLYVKKMVDDLCKTELLDTYSEKKEPDSSTDEVGELMRTLIASIYSGIRGSKTRLSTKDRFEMVRLLEEKGVFRVKDAVEIVATTIGISKFTVYSYLNKIKNGQSSISDEDEFEEQAVE